MRLESKKYLFNVRQASELVMQFVESKTFRDYSDNPLLRSGVERQLMVIGEALNRLVKIDTKLMQKISDYKKIISFRNIIVHGYDIIDDETVWGVVTSSLPRLHQEVVALLEGS